MHGKDTKYENQLQINQTYSVYSELCFGLVGFSFTPCHLKAHVLFKSTRMSEKTFHNWEN